MTIQQIKNKAEKEFNVNLNNKNRRIDFIKAKYLFIHCAMLYSSELVGAHKVASHVGNNQHGTIHNALYEFENIIKTDKTYRLISDKFIKEVCEDLDHFKLASEISNLKKVRVLEAKMKLIKEQLKILK